MFLFLFLLLMMLLLVCLLWFLVCIFILVFNFCLLASVQTGDEIIGSTALLWTIVCISCVRACC